MKKIIFAGLLLAVFAPQAYGSGIEVAPSKLGLEVPPGQKLDAYLTVFNPSADVQIYEVYPDDFAEQIQTNPKSFTLQAGEKKSVQISVRTDERKPGEVFKTYISVLAKPLADSGFTANSGVKIPITITVANAGKQKTPLLLVLAAVGVLGILGLAVFIFLRKNRPAG